MQVRTVVHVTLTEIEAKEILLAYLARQYGCKPEEIELGVVTAEQEKTEALQPNKYRNWVDEEAYWSPETDDPHRAKRAAFKWDDEGWYLYAGGWSKIDEPIQSSLDAQAWVRYGKLPEDK